MKKFLVFLVSCIVAICLGMTFYYFIKDEEVIKIKTSTLYLNAGDSVSLEELGFSHTHKKSETTINFNAGGEEVENIIKYDSTLKKFITTTKGGSTTIVITTNNKKFSKFHINVVVGNGSKDAPFHISSEDELFAIGSSKYDITPDNNINEATTSYYELMNDISITKGHNAIGYNADGVFESFEGCLNGNYHKISGMSINSNTYGGLFGIIGKKAIVENLYLENSVLNGEYQYAGTLAGIINGYVDRIGIVNTNIENTLTNSYTGGLAGKILTFDEEVQNFGVPSTAYRISIENNQSNIINGKTYVGGIAGEINCANIEAVKVNSIIKSTEKDAYIGGFAGLVAFDNDCGFIRESYSLSTINAPTDTSYKGALFGYINVGDGSTIRTDTVLLGLYYNKELNKGLDTYGKTTALISTTTVAGKTENQLKEVKTYVYYYKADSTPVSWLGTIWKLVEGQNPILKYTLTLPGDVNVDDSNNTNDNVDTPNKDNDNVVDNNPTDPDNSDQVGDNNNNDNNDNAGNNDNNNDNTGDNNDKNDNNAPIISPDIPVVNTDVVAISNAEELNNIATSTKKSYLIKNNIDLNGAVWTPKKLNSSTLSSEDDNVYVISNFVVRPTTNYCGIFSSISNSQISNIIFENVTIEIPNNLSYVGGLVGAVNNGSITNVEIRGLVIKSDLTNDKTIPQYTGGLVGASTSSSLKITDCSVQGSITGNLLNVGGIIGLAGANTIVSNSKFDGDLQGRSNIGSIASENQGEINNCSATATISNFEKITAHAYIGGAVGVNFNRVSNITVNVNMDIYNPVMSYIFSVGGIVGYNMNNSVVENSLATGAGIKFGDSKGTVILGGIVGENKGDVLECINVTKQIGNNNNLIKAGGIVGSNNGGLVYGCYTDSDVYGDLVGGIAYENTNKGNIKECSVYTKSNGTKPCLKGNEIASLVHSALSGKITDCIAITKSYGLDEESRAASIVIYFPCSADNYATFDTCVVSNEYGGNGIKNSYLETPADILSRKRCTGTITNCVIDTTYAKDVQEAKVAKGLFGLIKFKAGSESTYHKATTGEMKDFETYSNFSISTSTSTVWVYDGKTIPKLSASIKN